MNWRIRRPQSTVNYFYLPASLRILAALSCPASLVPLSAQPADTIRIAVIEGDSAINNIAARNPRDIAVKVTDSNGDPIENAAVTFTMPSAGPGGTFLGDQSTFTTNTGPDGVARATGIRPNRLAGTFEIRVTAAARKQTARAFIRQTNAAPAASASRKKILIGAVIAGAVAGGVLAATSGGGSSSPSSSTPAGGIFAGNPGFGPP